MKPEAPVTSAIFDIKSSEDVSRFNRVSNTKLTNYWLNKTNEKNIFKVVEWAHRQKIKIENLTELDIIEASKAYLRDPSHS